MSAINALSGSPAPATSSRFSEMSSEDFMKIIFTELQSQDPFKPNDSGALLEQMNSIRSASRASSFRTRCRVREG
jgi:flagellar hook assembly protein FlgD